MKRLLTIALVISMMLFGMLASAETAPTLEALSELEWTFCSGAGAWATTLQIDADGAFAGAYHDSEMGDAGEDYPKGSVYGCLFHGRLSIVGQVNDDTWTVHVDEVEMDEGQVPEAIEDGIRYVTADPYGIKAGHDMLLFLPGTPVEELPEGFLFWAHLIGTDATELPYYGLYDETEDTGFIGEAPLDEAGE